MPRRLRWASALPLTIVLLAAAVGISLMLLDYWRRGGAILAGSVLLAGVLRLVLPTAAAGVLAVRSKTFDVLFLLLCGALIVVTALAVTAPS